MRRPAPLAIFTTFAITVLAADAAGVPGGRAWQAVVCLALGAALGFAGWRLAGLLLEREALPTRLTGAFALAVTLSVVSATALGHWGLLTPRGFELLIAMAAALCLFLPRCEAPAAVSGGDRRELLSRLLLLFPVSLLLVLTLFAMDQRSHLPPGILSYDDTSYHLSAVAVWLHSHDLRMIKFAFGDGSTTFYPIGSELWSWVLLVPFRDSDVLARWSQLPFALFTLAAIAAVARRLGLSWPTALLAVVSYWSVPRAFPDLALSAGNDHALAFSMVAGVDAALLVAQRRRPSEDWRRSIYAGLVLGLLVGTKYIGVLFVPLLVAVWLAARWDVWRAEPPSGLSWARGAVISGLGMGGALLAGGYTYLRTMAVTGNPLFPAPVTLWGWRILPGWPEADPAVRRLEESSVDLFGLFWSRADLLGPLFRFVMLPGALLAALIALWSWRRGPLGRARAAVALLPLAILAVFAYLHDHREIRYVFAALALAGVSLGLAVEKLPLRVRRWLAGLLSCAWALAALATQTTSGQAAAVFGIALGLGALVAWTGGKGVHLKVGEGLAPSWAGGEVEPRRHSGNIGSPGSALWKTSQGEDRVLPPTREGASPSPTSGEELKLTPMGHRWPAWLLLLALALAALAALGLRSWTESYQKRRLDLWLDAAALERVTGGAPAVIAYLGGNRPYRLAGRRLQNRVEIVPTRGPVEDRYFDWHGSTGFPYSGGRFTAWSRNLRRLGVELVAVDRNDDPGLESGGRELRWMRAHPEQFQPLLQAGPCEIWRFDGGSGPR